MTKMGLPIGFHANSSNNFWKRKIPIKFPESYENNNVRIKLISAQSIMLATRNLNICSVLFTQMELTE